MEKFMAEISKRQRNNKYRIRYGQGHQGKTRSFGFEEKMTGSNGKNEQNLGQNAFNEPESLDNRRLGVMKNAEENKIENRTDQS